MSNKINGVVRVGRVVDSKTKGKWLLMEKLITHVVVGLLSPVVKMWSRTVLVCVLQDSGRSSYHW